MKFEKKVAFTLAEMMVVLLILSIITAAFLPVITKKTKTPTGIWKYASNNSDIYFGLGDSQGVAIGTNGFLTSEYGRLLLNTKYDTQNQIILKQGANVVANVVADSKGNIGLGNADFLNTNIIPTRVLDAVAIGPNAIVKANHTVAIGDNAKADLAPSAFGYSVALGAYSAAQSDGATSIGAYSKATGRDSIALGGNDGSASPGAAATNHCAIAIGPLAEASGLYGTALGAIAHAYGETSLAIGYQASVGASYSSSTAIGNGAVANASNQIMLGTSSHKVNIPGTLTVVSTNYPSDRRLKNVKDEYTQGLNKVRELKPMDFTYKKDTKKTPRVGVIAQDLQKVFPNAVTKGGDGFLVVRQEDMFYAMLNSIKELDNIVQGLIKDFKSLVARVQQLDDKVIAIISVSQTQEKQIKTLEAENKQLEKRLVALEKSSRK